MASRARGAGRTTPAAGAPEAFAWLAGRRWNSPQMDLFSRSGWRRFSGTWPLSGMTRSGRAFRLPPLVRLTSDGASSSWPTPRGQMGPVMDYPSAREGHGTGGPPRRLEVEVARQQGDPRWPTPGRMDGRREGVENDPGHWRESAEAKAERGITKQFPLNIAVQVPREEWPYAAARWRSPTSQDAKGIVAEPKDGQTLHLSQQVEHPPMWPTPSAQGSAGEVDPDLERRGRKLVNKRTGRVLQTNLATEVRYPTPRASDHKDPSRSRRDSKIQLREFVDRMYPTPNAADWRSGNRVNSRTSFSRLNDRVKYPTPRGSDHRGPGPSQTDNLVGKLKAMYARGTFPTPTAQDTKAQGEGMNPKARSVMLSTMVERYPTPRGGERGVGMIGGSGAWAAMKRLESSGLITRDELYAMSAGNGGLLNPTWVSWLMGCPLTWLHSSPEEASAELSRYLGEWEALILSWWRWRLCRSLASLAGSPSGA